MSVAIPQLIVQPDDGVTPVLQFIRAAQRSLLIKQFTFSDGHTTINMCHGCTQFDTKRRTVLKQGKKPKRYTLVTLVRSKRKHDDIDDLAVKKGILDKETGKELAVILNHCETGHASWPRYVLLQEQQAGLMYQGHARTTNSCFMSVEVDAVKEADALVPWFRNEPKRVFIAPPVKHVYERRPFTPWPYGSRFEATVSSEIQDGIKMTGKVFAERTFPKDLVAGCKCLHGLRTLECHHCSMTTTQKRR